MSEQEQAEITAWLNEHDSEDCFVVLPQRLRGRGRWLEERGRIKDCELMYDAAVYIESLRAQLKTN